MLIASGCQFDYWFYAFVIEGDYPPGDWVEVQCIDFRNSTFEVLAGTYEFSMQIDPPEGAKLPKKLQFWLRFYGPDGDAVYGIKGKLRKIDANRRIEGAFEIADTRIFERYSRLCTEVRTKGGGALTEGWKMGVEGGRDIVID